MRCKLNTEEPLNTHGSISGNIMHCQIHAEPYFNVSDHTVSSSSSKCSDAGGTALDMTNVHVMCPFHVMGSASV